MFSLINVRLINDKISKYYVAKLSIKCFRNKISKNMSRDIGNISRKWHKCKINAIGSKNIPTLQKAFEILNKNRTITQFVVILWYGDFYLSIINFHQISAILLNAFDTVCIDTISPFIKSNSIWFLVLWSTNGYRYTVQKKFSQTSVNCSK